MRFSEEDQIQAYILEYLAAVLPDAEVWHVPNGGPRHIRVAQKLNALGVKRGVADLVVVVARHPEIYLEVKSRKGRVSPEQREFGMRMQARGRHWAVVRSVEDVKIALKAIGVVTRETAA